MLSDLWEGCTNSTENSHIPCSVSVSPDVTSCITMTYLSKLRLVLVYYCSLNFRLDSDYTSVPTHTPFFFSRNRIQGPMLQLECMWLVGLILAELLSVAQPIGGLFMPTEGW